MSNIRLSVAVIRGKFANNYELQNYAPLVKNVKIMALTSLLPLEKKLLIEAKRLFSPADLPFNASLVKFISNRTVGDMHVLWGLEPKIADADILHTADPYYYFSFQAAQVRKHFPKKILISTVWETIPHNNEKTEAKKQIKKYTMQMTDVFVVHSQRSYEMLLQEGVSKSKVRYIGLGIDSARFHPSGHRNKEILFVGRLAVEKNPLVLLQAFIRFHATNPEYRLRFVGSGPLKKDLETLTHTAGLDKVVLFETATYDNIAKYYQNAEIFVLPSTTTATWEEQYGMVLLEAMASGIPIITTDSGAIPEVVGNAGIVLPQNNPDALANSLNRLSGNKTLRSKLGTIGRERVLKHYDSRQFAGKILDLYEETYRRHSRP